jgi:hypothetical protein
METNLNTAADRFSQSVKPTMSTTEGQAIGQ